MSKICPTCKKPCDSLKSSIKQGKIYEGCDNCLPQLLQQGDGAAFDRRYQQVKYRRELTQPNQRAYARAYPEDFKKRHGEELYRQMS